MSKKKDVIVVAWGLAVLLFVAVALFVITRPAHAADGFQWQHFGTDPYAATRTEAMQTRESAFRALGLPAPVIAQLMRDTEKPGSKTRLVVGDKLSAMLSKGGVVHRDVTIAWAAPVRAMEYAAPAEVWQIAWQGKIYSVFLPEICQNWSYKWTSEQVALAAAVPTGACPKGYLLVANAWSLALLPSGMRRDAEKLIASAEMRDAVDQRDYRPDDVSRTLGGQLRREVKVRFAVDTSVRVVLRDPQTEVVVADLGVMHVAAGVGSIPLSPEQRAKIVETIWPMGSFVSPTVSLGARRLWLFPNEWGNWCTMNVHGLVP